MARAPLSFYIDSSAGDDSNEGTSAERPLRGLFALNTRRLVPGDRVFLKRGSAFNGYMELKESGSAASPIVISTYGAGEPPELATAASGKPAITVRGSHVRIEDLHVSGPNGGYGILIAARTTGVTVRGCEIEGAGAGIVVLGTGHVIERNFIHDLTMIRNTPGGNDDYGAVGIWLNEPASNVRITGNRFINCRAPSFDYGSDGGVMETWGSVSGIEFFANYSEGNNGLFEAGSSSNAEISGISIHHNISVNDVSLFMPHSSGKFTVRFSDVSFVNNTAYNDLVHAAAFFNLRGIKPGGEELSIVNNVFINRNAVYALQDGGFDHRGNLYWRPEGGAVAEPGIRLHATETLDADPHFGKITSDGYTADPASPAIDSGVPTGFTADYRGTPVPSGSAHDRGAVEILPRDTLR